MNNQRLILESMAMDLMRVSLGLHRGSVKMADKFKEEVYKRHLELEELDVDESLRELIRNMMHALKSQKERVAEDALMYSVLLQNRALRMGR